MHLAQQGFCSKSDNNARHISKQIFSSCVSNVLTKKTPSVFKGIYDS